MRSAHHVFPENKRGGWSRQAISGARISAKAGGGPGGWGRPCPLLKVAVPLTDDHPTGDARSGIARGIVTDPTLLLCDEPTGDLDRKAGNEILDLLQALNREHGKTIIMVTHEPHAAARAARTVYLDKGQLSNEPVT